MEDGGGKVLRFDPSVEGIGSLTIRYTMDSPPLDSSTGQCAAEDVPPVVSASGSIVLGRSAKLADPNHQSVVEHSPLQKIFEQGRIGLIHRRHENGFKSFGILGMGVPSWRVVRVVLPSGPIDLDQ